MGSKKNRRHDRQAPVVQKTTNWAPIAVAVVAIAAAGLYLVARSSDPVPSADATGAAVAPSTTPTSPAGVPGPAASPVSSEPVTAEGPNDLPMPPLPYMAQAIAGPPELMRQAYVFAAQNPGVLGYVPCYCGCGQTDAHQSNVDCFVGSRAPNGAVESWDDHGMT